MIEPYKTTRFFRILWAIVRVLPPRIGVFPRVSVLRVFGAEIGNEVMLGNGVRVLGPSGLVIENRASVARDALLDARGGLLIQHGALVGFESVLLSWTHRFEDPMEPVQAQGFEGAPVTLGANSWLGTRSIVLPGVEIGSSAIVGAGSTVTSSIPAGVIAAGSPARELRRR